jgi:SagB-type dehydrogenase family enzyme
MAHALTLSFRQEVLPVEASGDRVTLICPWVEIVLTGLTPGLLAAMQALAVGGSTEDQLCDLVTLADGDGSLAQLYYHLERCASLGLLCYSLGTGEEILANVLPMTGGFRYSLEKVAADARFRLSRFAYCRREGDSLMLESPLSVVRAILPGHAGVALVAELAQPRTYRDLCLNVEGLAEDTAEAFLSLFENSGLIAEVDELGMLPEDNDRALVQWAFHDLMFHSRSRPGRHDYPMGGTFPFLHEIPPLPALKANMSEDIARLYKPDIARLERDDVPFSRVLEERRSIRDYGDQLINAKQLGEFLYRVGRVRRVIDADSERSLHHQITNRPYPSGGAIYDLELYLAINSCADIAAGIYHYDPLAHVLRKLAGRNIHVDALLRDAGLAAGLSSQPQILIILASRFQRLSWKYTGFAYATTLKNVGVLYQTMYLVAAAMGLAPCGLGAGNSALFAKAVGTNYLVESSVGEFLLGATPGRHC